MTTETPGPSAPGTGTPENGTPENGTPHNGTAENGTAENGTAGTDPEEGTDGPLGQEIARRAADTDVMVVATADVHGNRDVAVVHGPACVLRVLDLRHLAYPDTGADAVTASRSNLAEAPGVALLLIASGGDPRGVHLNGTARVVPVEELRREHPDLPADPVPGRSTDVWVVVEVGDAYLLDGDDVPAIAPLAATRSSNPAATGAAGGAAAGAAGGATAAGAASRTGAGDPASASRENASTERAPATEERSAASGDRGGKKVALVPVLVIIALLVVLVLAATAVGVSGLGRTSEASAPPPPAPAADTGPTGPPTLFGRVVTVNDPASVVVDVAGRPVPVSVIGIDATTIPGCAVPAALDFARRTLQGQEVTLVPDPTLPPASGGPTRAYAVLGTQSSYTDAAISAGNARAAGPSRYRAVFDQEQAKAQAAKVGMWGPPCVP